MNKDIRYIQFKTSFSVNSPWGGDNYFVSEREARKKNFRTKIVSNYFKIVTQRKNPWLFWWKIQLHWWVKKTMTFLTIPLVFYCLVVLLLNHVLREIIWHKEKQCASNDPSRRGWWMQAIYVVDGKWHKSLKLNIAAAAAAAALPGEQLSW